nr:RNA-directed DNA polymerase, eukaryota, reverse transcriptase zinc-binding domain protein [Tanacetum cinerariifolium]
MMEEECIDQTVQANVEDDFSGDHCNSDQDTERHSLFHSPMEACCLGKENEIQSSNTSFPVESSMNQVPTINIKKRGKTKSKNLVVGNDGVVSSMSACVNDKATLDDSSDMRRIGIQESKMEKVDSFLIRSMWPKSFIDFAYVGSSGASAGIIKMWHTSLFVKEEQIKDPNYLGVIGSCSSDIVWIIFGDFNVVRSIDEREEKKDALTRSLIEWDYKAKTGLFSPSDVDKQDDFLIELFNLNQLEREDLKPKSPSDIKDDVASHYAERFKEQNNVRPKFISPMFCKLSDVDASFLESSFTMDKVKIVVWSRAGSKSLRPDGLNFNFLKRILGDPEDRVLRLHQYADDALFFRKWSRSNANKLILILKCFEEASENEKGISWVKWNSILPSRKLGGLRVGSLHAKNLGLLGKWKWIFLTEKDALWRKVINGFYGRDGGLFLAHLVLLLAWDRVFEIKDAFRNKQYKPKDVQELFRKLFNDVQNIHEELAKYINTPDWNRRAFYNDDDDDDVDYTIAITPVLSTEKLDNSLSMGEEHLDTIPATKSDEVIKSSVEDLVPIPSESEEVAEIVIPKDKEIKDGNLREKLLNMNLLIVKIEALKDNPTLSSEFLTNFCFDLEEISSGSTTIHSDISLLDYEAFYFHDDHIEEISSGSTTTHFDTSLSEYDSFIFDLSSDLFPPTDRSDFTHEEFADELAHIISPPKYDCFYFRNLPDPGELIFILDSRIRENLSTTRVNLAVEDNHSPLLAYVVWIFLAYLTYPVIPPYLHSFGNEDTIFDSGIAINRFFV